MPFDTFEKEIKRHDNSAIEEASLILFLVDVQTGVTDLDVYISKNKYHERGRRLKICRIIISNCIYVNNTICFDDIKFTVFFSLI